MLSKINQEIREENTTLFLKVLSLREELKDMNTHVNNLDKEIERLNGENRYLLQRLKEMRHKTWFPVYKENLELQEEIKQYQAVLESVEKFVGRFSNEKR
jgi:predicted metalloprotease with PDZ domain